MDWIKPSGLEITTNDSAATVTHCESLGWKKVSGDLFNLNDITVERINGMSGKDMKKIIKQFNLEVDASLSVKPMRKAVVNALFE